MGLLDLFKKEPASGGASKADKELARLERMVSNKLSQNIDRQEALDRLCALGTAGAARVLLKRLSWNLDPSITDQEEKEQAVQGIAGIGRKALGPIREYCAKAETLTGPLKALRRILEGDELIEELLTILDQFDTEYMRNPEPKLQLIQILAEHPSDEVRVSVEPFLLDVSEGVRFAAVTTVFAVNDAASTPSLVAALIEEESLRVKNRIAGGIAERGWEIPSDLHAGLSEALPDGFRLANGRIVAR